MKHTKRTSCLSFLLVLAMLATCFVAFSVTSSAELATDLPTSWGAELPEGAVAWGSGDMTTASTSLAGSGTEAAPYLIADVADFMYFVNTAAAAAKADTYFQMTGDVYFPVITNTTTSSRDFTPPNFAGHFNGNGHTIWNPRNGYKAISSTSTVFGTLDGATVENLTVKGAFFANMYGNNSSANAAGLADKLTNGGTVRNCHVVDAFLSGTRVGGLIQNVDGEVTISGCTASGTFAPAGVTDDACFGGIVGYVGDGATLTVENCVNRMSCELDDKYVEIGGIVGCAKRSKLTTKVTIRNCQNYGSYINNTIADAALKGIGGIMGHVYYTVAIVMENCQNYGDFTASNNCGGIIGLISATGSGELISLTECANYGSIHSTGLYAGGMIGQVTNWAGSMIAVQDSANYGSIQAVNCAGGLAGAVLGYSSKSTHVKCINYFNSGNVTATTKYAGLLIGLYSRGTTGNNKYVVYANGSWTAPNIEATNTVLTGSVSAKACAGSICGGYTSGKTGYKMFVNTTNVYVDCTIKATERSGAIAGAWLSTDTEVAGTFYNTTGLTLTMTDSKFHVTLNGATPANDYFVTTDGVTEGKSASLTALGTAFTDGTALAALNTYASANTLTAWVKGTNSPELEIFYQAPTAVQVTLDGATLSLRDTMTLKLFVKASSVSEIADLATIKVNDGTKDYAGTLDATAENYVFEIAGLEAKDMGTAKTYTVKYTLESDTGNPITCDTGVTYSPLQYAINMYNKNKADTTPNANFAALLTSMVRYMDAAGATGAKSTFAAATGYAFDETDSTNANNTYAAIVSKDAESQFSFPADTAVMSATLTSGITLTIAPATGKTFTEVTVKIGNTGLEVKEVDGKWRVTGINPGDLYNELTFTIKTKEGTVTGTYSIARYLNSYVVSDKTETAVKDLAKATALYMDAFITYKTLG